MSWSKEDFERFCKKNKVSPITTIRCGHIDLPGSGQKQKTSTCKHDTKITTTRKPRRQNRASLSDAFPQYRSKATLDQNQKTTGGSSDDFHDKDKLEVISYRVTILDFDNFIGGLKSLIDVVKYAGLIRDDSEEAIELIAKQVKVDHREDEKTVIRITYGKE